MVFSAAVAGGFIAVVPGLPLRAQVAVNFVEQAIEFRLRRGEVWLSAQDLRLRPSLGVAHLFKLHVQVEDFFEQVGRRARRPSRFWAGLCRCALRRFRRRAA